MDAASQQELLAGVHQRSLPHGVFDVLPAWQQSLFTSWVLLELRLQQQSVLALSPLTAQQVGLHMLGTPHGANASTPAANAETCRHKAELPVDHSVPASVQLHASILCDVARISLTPSCSQ